jgi:hypothetical protein
MLLFGRMSIGQGFATWGLALLHFFGLEKPEMFTHLVSLCICETPLFEWQWVERLV